MNTAPKPIAAQAAIARARTALAAASDALNAAAEALGTSSSSPTNRPDKASVTDPLNHRRDHRPGRPSKIDTDRELNAFVDERIDHMTFEELAAAIAETFPPGRRVGKSALHAWWQINVKSHPSSSRNYQPVPGSGV